MDRRALPVREKTHKIKGGSGWRYGNASIYERVTCIGNLKTRFSVVRYSPSLTILNTTSIETCCVLWQYETEAEARDYSIIKPGTRRNSEKIGYKTPKTRIRGNKNSWKVLHLQGRIGLYLAKEWRTHIPQFFSIFRRIAGKRLLSFSWLFSCGYLLLLCNWMCSVCIFPWLP